MGDEYQRTAACAPSTKVSASSASICAPKGCLYSAWFRSLHRYHSALLASALTSSANGMLYSICVAIGHGQPLTEGSMLVIF